MSKIGVPSLKKFLNMSFSESKVFLLTKNETKQIFIVLAVLGRRGITSGWIHLRGIALG